MALIAMGFGLLIAVLGAAGLLQPGRLQRWVAEWPAGPRYVVAVSLRLVLGVALLLAAEASRYPTGVRVLGWITLAAAAVLALMGPKRLDRLVPLWTRRPAGEIRAWSGLALMIGLFLIYTMV